MTKPKKKTYIDSSSKVQSLNLTELLSKDSNYLIPMYQRNYAWSIKEIQQLIQDIIDAHKRDANLNYYLGTLVVFKRDDGSFEVIDGQQRLTTLTLLAIYLSKAEHYRCAQYLEDFEKPNLKFDSRPHSTSTLSLLFKNDLSEIRQSATINHSMLHGYEVLEKVINHQFGKEQSKITIDDFCSYLFEKVQIARVPVPQKTDLNHYFEVMNNRGEQLEKHEIIKARLLSTLHSSDTQKNNLTQLLVNTIWQACANMNQYVQYGFESDLRYEIFSKNLINFELINFNELLGAFEQFDTKKKHQLR